MKIAFKLYNNFKYHSHFYSGILEIWVAGSIVLSFIFFEGKLIGTREGTVISAIFVGITVKIYKPIIEKPLTKLIKR